MIQAPGTLCRAAGWPLCQQLTRDSLARSHHELTVLHRLGSCQERCHNSRLEPGRRMLPCERPFVWALRKGWPHLHATLACAPACCATQSHTIQAVWCLHACLLPMPIMEWGGPLQDARANQAQSPPGHIPDRLSFSMNSIFCKASTMGNINTSVAGCQKATGPSAVFEENNAELFITLTQLRRQISVR